MCLINVPLKNVMQNSVINVKMYEIIERTGDDDFKNITIA
jgi:hypothetical protein